tara:strand:+ start:388 stop:1563 length:1176 start_codon:yes stop_codon:yes gene_type:complete
VGGDGLRTTIAGPAYPVGFDGPGPTTGGWFAGGGHGSGSTKPDYFGTSNAQGGSALESSGSGGNGNSGGGAGGTGGSGIVIVRYRIGTIGGTAKASGGTVSFYNSKTIHTFTSTGTFETPSSFNETVEYVIVGGGGGGAGTSGGYGGGGGGAGGYQTGTTPVGGEQTVTINIGAGGNGAVGGDTSAEFPAGTLTSPGGGSGGGQEGAGGAGASGGGGGGYSGGAGPSGTLGNDGGAGNGNPAPIYSQYGGGGGGAGAPGDGGNAQPYPANGGNGGDGLQVPLTFRNPATVFDGDTDSQWFLAGGGGGAASPGNVADQAVAGTGGKGGGGKGAFVDGSVSPSTQTPAIYGLANTGGGAGGSFGSNANPTNPDIPASGSTKGGSGIVLIAYPT